MQAKQTRSSLVQSAIKLVWHHRLDGSWFHYCPIDHIFRALAGFHLPARYQCPQIGGGLGCHHLGGGRRGLAVLRLQLVGRKAAKEWTRRLQPFVFVGPALAILAWFLAIPALRTLYLSLMNATSFNFVWFENYVFAFTDRIMLEAFRNNLLWMIFGTSFSRWPGPADRRSG